MIDFSDLEALDRQEQAQQAASFQDAQASFAAKATPEQIICRACNGSGVKRWGYYNQHSGACFKCNGTGKTTAQRIARQAAAAKGKVTKVRNDQIKRAEFRAAHPDVCAWLSANDGRFDFATSLSNNLAEYGTLTDGQVAGVRKCIARAAERKAERATNAPAVDTTGTDQLKASLQRAIDSGLKRVKISVDELSFSLAKPNSKNPGAVYVKSHGEYAGKIDNGRFFAAYGFNQIVSRVETVMRDPLAAAKEYGVRTGKCSCCGRELTDPNSIAAGIGPICEGKFFG